MSGESMQVQVRVRPLQQVIHELSGEPLMPYEVVTSYSATSWDDIVDKPLAFPPAAHTHTVDEFAYGASWIGSAVTPERPPAFVWSGTAWMPALLHQIGAL